MYVMMSLVESKHVRIIAINTGLHMTTESKDLVHINVRVRPELAIRAKRFKLDHGVKSLQDLVVAALTEYMDRRESNASAVSSEDLSQNRTRRRPGR